MLEPPEFELDMFGPPVNQNKKKGKGSAQQIKKYWRGDKGPSSHLIWFLLNDTEGNVVTVRNINFTNPNSHGEYLSIEKVPSRPKNLDLPPPVGATSKLTSLEM
jgi:hypothetical protein